MSPPAYVRMGSASMNASAEQLNELVLSRIDKCRAILRLKGKGLITVRAIGYRLGSYKPVADTHYAEEAECFVTDCTAHFVRLHHPARAGANYAEAIERVEIVWDEVRNRAMLIIRAP